MQSKTPAGLRCAGHVFAVCSFATFLCAGMLSAGCSTPSGQGVDPFAAADEPEAADLLDEPATERAAAAARRATPSSERLVLPLPPAESKKVVDGKLDDWDKRKLRSFDGKNQIVSGEQFWSGDADASFKVGLDSDVGHLYFAVEVRDDQVIDAESKDIMSDGVIIWLQDPALKELIDSLPVEMAQKKRIQSEIAILFTPDGQFWRFDSHGTELYREGINAATQKTDNGYRVEVSLGLGVLGQVAALPVDRIAFRVEVMDGDEASRRGEQTRMSMLPDETGPRFALVDLKGWLPYVPAYGQPPRPGALGRWVLADGAWHYDSFEVVPNYWRTLEDTAEFRATLNKEKVFDEICPLATHERELVEAYQSTRDTHRAGLLLCGLRAPRGRCADDATTELYWVHLSRKSGAWSLAQYTSVTEESLPQCATKPRPGGEFYSKFSLLPLEMLGASVWGVGWTKTDTSRDDQLVEKGIWFANPSIEKPYMGAAISEKEHARRRQRTLARSRVYLADVDRVQGLDICEIEHVQEQSCTGLNRGCRTQKHGEVTQVHVKLWVPQKKRFEPYLQTKHRGCSAVSFDFSTRRGFMLLNEAGRLGVVASPANGGAQRQVAPSAPSEQPADLTGGGAKEAPGSGGGEELW